MLNAPGTWPDARLEAAFGLCRTLKEKVRGDEFLIVDGAFLSGPAAERELGGEKIKRPHSRTEVEMQFAVVYFIFWMLFVLADH